MSGVAGLEAPWSGRAFPRVRIGHVSLDLGRLHEVLLSIEGLVARGQGGWILTPDVEQVVLAERDAGLREALATAELSLAGGPALVRAARVMGLPLPEPRAGAEWLPPLARLARERAWRVLVVAERPGLAAWSAGALRDRYGLLAVGVAAPGVPANARGPWVDRLLERMALIRPHLVLVSMATPRQELFCQYAAARLEPAVVMGTGAALESLLDGERAAPRWRTLAGLGWRERCRWLVTAPVRLLFRNLTFLRILARR